MVKRYLCAFMTAVLATGFFYEKTFAYAGPSTIRVGLESKFSGVSSVSIGNGAIYLGYGNQPGPLIYASSGFKAVAGGSSYGSTGKSFSNYAEAKAYAGQLTQEGQASVPAFLGTGNWSVYMIGFGNPVPGNARRVVITDGGSEAIVYDNGGSNLQIFANGDILSLGDRRYRGFIEFSRAGGGMTLVNIVPVQEYLYSVTASEMPTSWNIEALKAQAVAARSYTYTRMGVHSGSGYDLCDMVHCQAYNGAGSEAASTTQAVNETAGVVAFYNGAPINAVYCSSAGGGTEDASNVWPDDVPYLKAKKELFVDEGRKWERRFTLAEIDSLLSAKGYNIGKAIGVSIASTAESGRVTELVIRGSGGSKSLYKEDIRTFFSGSKDGNLDSKMFVIGTGDALFTEASVSVMGEGGTINEFLISKLIAITSELAQKAMVSDITVVGEEISTSYSMVADMTKGVSSGEGNDVILTGAGWGHGVGMSQYGAKAMAENGYTYKEILEFYYTGIEVRQ